MENKKLNKAKVLLTMLLEELTPDTGFNFYNVIGENKIACNDEVVYKLLENDEVLHEFLDILTRELEEKFGDLKHE